MKQRQYFVSVRSRLLVFSIALLAVFVLLLTVYGAVIVRDLNDQLLSEAEEPVHNYMQEFQEQNESLEQYLAYLAVTNNTFHRLSAAGSEAELYLASDPIQSELAAMSGMSGSEYIIVLYHTGFDYMLSARRNVNLGDEETMLEERTLRQELRRALRKGGYPSDRWFCVPAGEEILYTRVARFQNILCAVAYPLSRLQEALPSGEGIETALYYEGEPLFGVQPPAALPEAVDTAVFQNGYLIAQAGEGALILARFAPEGDLSKRLPGVLFLLAGAVLLIFLLGMLYLWNGFYRPVARLAAAMGQLETSSLTPDQLDHVYRGAEFRQMNAGLKNLLSQITEWKVKAYETELERRDAQLQYLRAQIRPHFYLNCLKNLYAMAQVSTPEKMQETIRCLSVHMRYIFSDHAQLTSLGKELELCQNYVELFGSMNVTYPIECSIEVEEGLLSREIPPVTLLSLVENCIKYSFQQGRPLKILISGALLEGEEGELTLLDLSVRDNGGGFTEEWLERFNNLERKGCAGEHVGMSNLVRRCRELYGENFHIAFYNGQPEDDYCGACVDLFLPAEEKENSNEASDCR